MRATDREYVREVVRRELNELRRETDRRFLELANELREELAQEVGDITRRVDLVHSKALTAMTDAIDRRHRA